MTKSIFRQTMLAGALAVFAFHAQAAPKHAPKPAPKIEEPAAVAEEDIPTKLVVDPTANAATAPVDAGAAAASAPAPAVDPMSAAAAADVVKAAEATKAPTMAEVAKLPESEIPVLTGSKEVKKASGSNLTRILITLGVLALFLGASIFGLKRWAVRKGGKNQNARIKVLTTHALGPKKSLAIIQVAGESILVGITDHNISMLKTLALIDDEVPENVPNSFGNALDEYEFEETPAQQRRETEDFTMRGLSEIRDSVSTRGQRSQRSNQRRV